MAKGPGGNVNTANNISSQQLGVASAAGQRSADDYSQFKTMLQPITQQQTALASGNREAALAASMPVLSKLSAGFNGAKQNILNSMPVGAARDRALADLTTQMYSTVGGAQAGAVQQAPTTLANIGSSLGNISLQELGAMLSGYQGGAQTNANAGQMAAQQQQSLLNFFGNLAGAGAGLISPIKLCWVAEAIYGPCDMRTFAVRAWLRGRFRKTFAGICATTLYAIIGQPVGWLAQRSPRLRATLKPLFDRALCAAVSLTA